MLLLLGASISAEGGPTLLGIAAVISAIGGVVATILSHRSSGREAREEEEERCRERLKAARSESEKLAQALHEIRMRDRQ